MVAAHPGIAVPRDPCIASPHIRHGWSAAGGAEAASWPNRSGIRPSSPNSVPAPGLWYRRVMHVFVSFPSEHRGLALRVAAALRARGFVAFCSEDDLRDGEAWRARIDRELERASVYVVLFDREALRVGRYFELEVDLVSRRVGEPGRAVLSVLVGDARSADLPRALREAQVVDEPGEDALVDRVVRASSRHRSQRRTRGGLLGMALAVLVVGSLAVVWPWAERAVRCQSIYADTESAKLRVFAAEARKVWIIGQTLNHVSNNEKDFVFETILGRENSEVRILMMHPDRVERPNPGLTLFRTWSGNPDQFVDQAALSTSHFRTWLAEAAAAGLALEVRQVDMVPFSANIIDWDDPSRAALQERPYLYRSTASDRPIFEFTRSCNAQTFDNYVGTFEQLWEVAEPLAGG